MALVKCPECRATISNKADNCVSCGWKVEIEDKQEEIMLNKKSDEEKGCAKKNKEKKIFFKTPKGIILIIMVCIVFISVFTLFGTVISEERYYSYRVEYNSEEEMLDDLCGTWITCSSDDMHVLNNNSYKIFSDNYTYRAIGWNGFDETYEYTLNFETSEIIHMEGDETFYADIIEIDGEKYIRSEGQNRGFIPEMKPFMLSKKEVD